MKWSHEILITQTRSTRNIQSHRLHSVFNILLTEGSLVRDQYQLLTTTMRNNKKVTQNMSVPVCGPFDSNTEQYFFN